MRRRNMAAFATVTTLFFAWGFISSNNDPLLVSLRLIFDLSYTEAFVTQIVFSVAFGLMSLPAAAISNRIGPVNTVLAALVTMIAGCLLLWPAAVADAYIPILAALFVLAIGITVLQVASNPLAAALGSAESSHFRLTLAQALNSLGVVVGANYGARLLLGREAARHTQPGTFDAASRARGLGDIVEAYAFIAMALAVLFIFIWCQRHRIEMAITGGGVARSEGSVLGAFKSRWAVFGAITIGLYVGAEVSVGGIMINFLGQSSTLGLPFAQGARYLAYFYWGGALVGRFVGSYALTRVPAARLLAGCGLAAAGLCGLVVLATGPIAGYAALAIGLFNSIMFPTIFSLTLERAAVSRSSVSGLLFLATSAGAVLPILVGMMADTAGLGLAFAVPLVGYALITAFAVTAGAGGNRLRCRGSSLPVPAHPSTGPASR
ncbi:MFS transporter [Hephaestia sp. GCM10023244]|uniref:MFS transporter n=1 Tax=unclassified Hephaestia TaxID=2631281 RepID=UPI0020779230|nr:MFS transporter [Hephaestia sp. MAHUQ-44]MCM8731004.1 MFS transporter [Hephaestia sp. MAHUQ-44]